MNDNPYPNASDTMHYELHTAWDEGYAEGFAAGRAAASPDPPDGQQLSYRVRDRDSDYKAMCHEDRDHAELLLKAWLADGRDAVIESRVVYDAGWKEER